jgi:hypothetical protein
MKVGGGWVDAGEVAVLDEKCRVDRLGGVALYRTSDELHHDEEDGGGHYPAEDRLKCGEGATKNCG